MIQIDEKKQCTGCSACSCICPRGCIRMEQDSEGFFYPQEDITNCIHCNLCEDVCPVKKQDELSNNTYVIGAQNLNDRIRSVSSAGGLAGVIYKYIFSKGGIVFGAGFDENNHVAHMSAESMEECLRKQIFSSKYVSSDINNSFYKVKQELLSGRYVCFVGLPCQVAGLKSYLSKEYTNLLLIDLVCYGVPSSKLYAKYLGYLQGEYKKRIVNVNFRDKMYGYASPSMSVTLDGGKKISQNSKVKSFLRCFFSNIASRPSCYECYFKGIERVSDITIGDCKSIGQFSKELDDDLGTTVMYIHSIKGSVVFDKIKSDIRYNKLPLEAVLKTSGKKVLNSLEYNPDRDAFFADIDRLSYPELVNLYCPAPFSEKAANVVKGFLRFAHLNKMGIMKIIKK